MNDANTLAGCNSARLQPIFKIRFGLYHTMSLLIVVFGVALSQK